MIFLNEALVAEIATENDIISFEQFDYFRESTYYNINQIIIESDMNIILNEGKITDTLKAIMQKIKQLIQKFIGWVVGLIKRIKDAIFGRKRKLDKLKSDVNKKAQKAKQAGIEYIDVKEPLRLEKRNDDGKDSDKSSSDDNDSNKYIGKNDDTLALPGPTSDNNKKHRGSKGPHVEKGSYKIESKIDITFYQISRKNYLHSYFNDVVEQYGQVGLGVSERGYFTPGGRKYADDRTPDYLEDKLKDLNDLKYDFDITKAIESSKEKIPNTVEGYKDAIDWVSKINNLGERVIDDLQRYIGRLKKYTMVLDIDHDHSEATEEQKKNLLKTASLMADLNNAYLKKMTELLQFTIKINDIIFEKNMEEMEKFTKIAV